MSDYSPDLIGLQIVAYTAVASMAVLLFDFTITFDSEVRFTWGRKWGITRIAFVVSRYLPFVGLVMIVYYSVESTHGGIPNLGRFTAIYDSIRWLSIAAAEVLLVTRIYVIWGCEKRFLALAVVLSAAISAVVLVISIIDAIKSGVSTRGVFEERRDASMFYGLLVFGELVMLLLTLYKHFKSYRLEGSPLPTTVCRDGIVYMLCITLVSMANCVTIAVLPSSYTALLAGPQVVAHSVLASRILFNLRAMTDLQDVATSELVVSVVVFSRSMAFQTPSGVDHTEWN
ncbi:uncharacterized protein EDB91DRAFT_1334806 [Suillus paluster]|uniref:uncharacterized protein n=1 Tax=Suillus paluster TaxID=48578 RepID=UPI001B878BB6|nr:uncharacterized protein EDB91DRAFT_1334806 [Suillus paluster]KAG1747979.1 hypothetical protein EDB91DRAFT_1334806 [Suillus paluster]